MSLNRRQRLSARGEPRCIVCGCTENDACQGGCSWVTGEVCSVCASAVISIITWMRRARRISRAALWREVEREAVRGAS